MAVENAGSDAGIGVAVGVLVGDDAVVALVHGCVATTMPALIASAPRPPRTQLRTADWPTTLAGGCVRCAAPTEAPSPRAWVSDCSTRSRSDGCDEMADLRPDARAL